jgi:hypothetical protein
MLLGVTSCLGSYVELRSWKIEEPSRYITLSIDIETRSLYLGLGIDGRWQSGHHGGFVDVLGRTLLELLEKPADELPISRVLEKTLFIERRKDGVVLKKGDREFSITTKQAREISASIAFASQLQKDPRILNKDFLKEFKKMEKSRK